MKLSLYPRCQAFILLGEISTVIVTFAINGKLGYFLQIAAESSFTAIFTLRTYAIYGRSWIVFFLLAIPGFLNVASNIVRTHALHSTNSVRSDSYIYSGKLLLRAHLRFLQSNKSTPLTVALVPHTPYLIGLYLSSLIKSSR